MFTPEIIDIFEGRAPKLELKIIEHKPPVPLIVTAVSGRELLRVTRDGECLIADDLTLEEAKEALRGMAVELLSCDREGVT